MGKATKNGTSSGVDERLKSERKCKSSSVSLEAISVGETETFNRPKTSGGATKHQPVPGKSNSKNKPRSPSKNSLNESTNRVSRPSTSNATKASAGLRKTKNLESKMKPEAECLEKKQQFDIKEIIGKNDHNIQVAESNLLHDSTKQENGNENGVNGNENLLEGTFNVEKNSNQNGNQVGDREDEYDFHLEAEENHSNVEMGNGKNLDEFSNAVVKEGIQTENYSVDVVESTTSEAPELTELSKEKQDSSNDIDTNGTNEEVKDKTGSLEDSKKNAGENNADQSDPGYTHKDATFGKALRTISGRSSYGRMRNITDQKRKMSPNSSLFVNTSLSEDADAKLAQHRSVISSTNVNGGVIDNKRKCVHELAENRAKKMKTQDSVYNSALEILKYPFSPKKPAQVSAPFNVKVEKQEIELAQEVTPNEVSPNKKWCILM